jgi:sugar lactone lactonase YvrE
MSVSGQIGLPPAVLAVALVVVSAARIYSQASTPPLNEPIGPYQIAEFGKLPEGRKWGASASIQVDRDGRSIWVAERCGANTCANSNLPSVLKFDASGRLVKSFGAGTIVFPHGMFVDTDGNVWVADAQANRERTKGHQVFKFSPDGTILLTLGKAGVAGQDAGLLDQPCDVAVAPNGDIFVADGHGGQQTSATQATTSRIVKFSKDGKFLKTWGKLGSGPGEFRTPHSLFFDSQGRLFVADRGNNRIQIFDQEGKYLDEWKQFSRVSSIYIDKNDVLYASDSESNDTTNPGWKRGIRIGSARDGKVKYFIPDTAWGTNPAAPAGGMEGATADAQGNVYGTNVWPNTAPTGALYKYLKR